MTEYKTICDVVEQDGKTFCRVQLSVPDWAGCVLMIPFDVKATRTEEDEDATDEANDIIDGRMPRRGKAEAFARALDTLGWMIVRQSYDQGELASTWPLG